MTQKTTMDVIRDVLTKRCPHDEKLAGRCIAHIEAEIYDLDTNPIYADCKKQFKIGHDEYPIIEEHLRGEPKKNDIMKEIKTRVDGLLAQDKTIGNTRVQLNDAVIETFLNAGYKSL